jgi:3-hydroxybutyryl-CoA dehydrogenase
MSEIVSAKDVRAAAVIGAGTMGHGIAQVVAMAGIDVRLYDVTDEFVQTGLARIRGNLDKGVAKGKVTEADRDATMARVTGTTVLTEAVFGVDLVIEAAPEVPELKRALFSDIDTAVPPHALLATNTSSLSIATIAAAVARPSRLIGLHFFNPVHVMKLLEIVRHGGNDDAIVATARGLAERMGKTPIVVRDAPGFASSRLGLAIGLEAMRMVEQGVASAADIDTAMKLGYGHPMGPLELTDLVGLDVRLSIAEYLSKELGRTFRPPELLRSMVADGKLGAKSGEGFYRWRDGKRVVE